MWRSAGKISDLGPEIMFPRTHCSKTPLSVYTWYTLNHLRSNVLPLVWYGSLERRTAQMPSNHFPFQNSPLLASKWGISPTKLT
ncbi:hypothetical protein AVEN_199997-1 [Araneus ventricosus]|uniref:Uncharacterized protein n=1 Tax=Araneus ventricosus TaxID=182803 RepID=A0A4Y2BUU3_ARAVE|nr:hypothetical protein AVEN_199997-1 [Araneus ventricosus]